MSLLTRLSFAQRFYLVNGLVSASLVAVAIFAWVQLSQISATAQRVGAVDVAQLSQISALELAVTRSSLQLRHAMLSRNKDERDQALGQIALHRQQIDELVKAYRVNPASRAEADFISAALVQFWHIAESNVGLVQSGDKEAAFAFLVDKTIPARNVVLEKLALGVEAHKKALTGAIKLGVEQRSDQLVLTLKIMVAAVIALLVASVWLLARNLRQRIDSASQIAQRVRDGDLAFEVVDRGRDEFNPLLSALTEMRNNLAELVTSIRQNAESVATASAQISQGNTDLSVRTEKQASALQQTAASMEEINGTAQNNADNAAQASQLANQASGVADQGSQVVGEVVNTMGRIEQSSQKISQIISVIDEIAFQTNLLALNAGVEAARAGEAGRGFAVVAQEVRELAQRCAEAARQVKTLINKSVERVNAGSSLVDKAGSTMLEVKASVQRVSDIVGEIAAGSREQMSGVSQVSEAVTHMDQATQQNAALVEESAAAAESLRQQADTLVQAVALFRTSESAAAPGMPRATPAAPATGATFVERRGPQRATNVSRPDFGRKPAAATPRPAPAATGTDGEWASF
ncbi:UNVERIFIED_ORG: methyl-accepting chemotaxis protein [Shinella sp. XGS7]|nr:methyl-accepting chemotaxis protein [Shinella sp. XGS7]